MQVRDDELMWQQLLPEHDASPLQVQLRTALVSAILDGRLPVGLRLPSGRELARLARVSRNTAVLVYDRLVADGYLEARARDGYFVSGGIERASFDIGTSSHRAGQVSGSVSENRQKINVLRSAGINERIAAGTPVLNGSVSTLASSDSPDWRARIGDHDTQLRWLDRPPGWRRIRYPFVFGQFDTKLFPLSDWRECSRQALEVTAVENWAQDGEGFDSPMLIEQLIRRVLPRRGIAATPDQILLTLGTQHGLYLLAELFGRPGVRVGVEDPGYMDARNIFSRHGAEIVPLAVDANGVELSEELATSDYVYCTPSHQCPTGVTMSTDRRVALLAHAARRDQVIFEDDYDPETQYVGQPLPALKAIDKSDRVVYLSSLSKLLAPGLRIGYIVAPAELIARLRLLRRLMVRQVPGNNQIAAALFIQQGYYDRLLQQTREVLGQRAAALTDALHRYVPGADFRVPQGGSSVWLRLSGRFDMLALRGACIAQGVLFDPGEPFFIDPCAQSWIRVGFSSIPLDRIEPGIRELGRVIALHTRRAARADA